MKRSLLMLLLILGMRMQAQENLYLKLRQAILKEYPELKLDNKLIVINVWAPSLSESRTKNVELSKAYATYEYAKLKGGVKGMIGVMICLDADLQQQEIALSKDKVTKGVYLKNTENIDLNGINTLILNSKGNEVIRNIQGDLFKEINSLITR